MKGYFLWQHKKSDLGKVEFSLDLFKTETVKAYQDLTMEFVMKKGLIEDSVK